jgi:hypothetical protein
MRRSKESFGGTFGSAGIISYFDPGGRSARVRQTGGNWLKAERQLPVVGTRERTFTQFLVPSLAGRRTSLLPQAGLLCVSGFSSTAGRSR